MLEAIQSFDESVLLFIQETLRFDFLTPIMLFITRLGDSGFIWILLGVIMLFPKKTRRAGVVMLLCLAGAFIVNDLIIKPMVARVRPYETIAALNNLLTEGSFSFPSGHTNSSFACALALTLIYGKKGAWAYLLAVLIAFSRCYVGVHYLTDIFAGMVIGTVMSFVVFKLVGRRILQRD